MHLILADAGPDLCEVLQCTVIKDVFMLLKWELFTPIVHKEHPFFYFIFPFLGRVQNLCSHLKCDGYFMHSVEDVYG